MSYLFAALIALSLGAGLPSLIRACGALLRRRREDRPLPPTRHVRVGKARNWAA